MPGAISQMMNNPLNTQNPSDLCGDSPLGVCASLHEPPFSGPNTIDSAKQHGLSVRVACTTV